MAGDGSDRERSIYAYTFVRAPFVEVARLVADDPAGVLGSAASVAAAHGRAVCASLRVRLGAFEIGREATIDIGQVRWDGNDRVQVALRWRDATSPGCSRRCRQRWRCGGCRGVRRWWRSWAGTGRRGGALGAAVDVLVGHRVAEAMLDRFVDEVGARIQREVDRRQPAVSQPVGGGGR